MRLPIVLAHGIAPFDEIYQTFAKGFRYFLGSIGFANDRLDYFKGIASHLRGQGLTVFAPRVEFAGSVERRSQELATAVRKITEETAAPKVHVIAHSMGGLDARHMIVNESMQDSVATLTTIGTPHLGTSFADSAFAVGGRDLAEKLSRLLKIDLNGFSDLTTEACRLFNQTAEIREASNAVHYITYSSHQVEGRVLGPLKPSWKLISQKEGDNDGLVPVSSQRWCSSLAGDGKEKPVEQFTFPFGADHLNEIGWWDLNQLHSTRWWNLRPLSLKRNFEMRIKDLYLKIAQHAEAFPPPSEPSGPSPAEAPSTGTSPSSTGTAGAAR